MKQLFIIYQVEGGGIGYKPAKVNLPVGARICLDREKMKFAKVEKIVNATAEEMKNAWNVAKAQNRYIETSANFKVLFFGQF
ncbi:hypothetical protein [Prevotella sp. tc2-28]|uniref:hypothetical protein n=1 Tax=Prevotella sp. tc2-28 TaxID=1761888 RepID=UPI00115FF42E|nr:hypothetical protein [Prevotella sp. tc2-28]